MIIKPNGPRPELGCLPPGTVFHFATDKRSNPDLYMKLYGRANKETDIARLSDGFLEWAAQDSDVVIVPGSFVTGDARTRS